jgi:hypothetical protein
MDCRNNSRVGSAAADIALHGGYDLRVRGIRLRSEKRHGGKDHSRSAVGALHGAFVEKGLLHRVKVVPLRKSLNRCDGLPRDGGDGSIARAPWPAINEHGAGTTLTFATAVFATRQIQLLAEYIK